MVRGWWASSDFCPKADAAGSILCRTEPGLGANEQESDGASLVPIYRQKSVSPCRSAADELAD
jgi:hypothetical protein